MGYDHSSRGDVQLLPRPAGIRAAPHLLPRQLRRRRPRGGEGRGSADHKIHQRDIAAADFFTGMFETALQEGEIVTQITFPSVSAAAYAKFPNPASRYATVGVMVAKTDDGVRVAITGASPCVFRASEMEAALDQNLSSSSLDGISLDQDSLMGDMHASAEYRAHLCNVMAKRAVDRLN